MSDTLANLRRMANQIAANFEILGYDKAVLATADHINQFWDPRMRVAIFADDRSLLGPVAGAAIDHLAAGHQPQPQTRATEFGKAGEVHGSDAG